MVNTSSDIIEDEKFLDVLTHNGRPIVVTLCGSAKFEEEFKFWNERLTLQGYIVFSLSVYPSDKGEKNWYSDTQKKRLDDIHKTKILCSDAILVINKDGYIGESTKSEILFAHENNKVIFLSKDMSAAQLVSKLERDVPFKAVCKSDDCTAQLREYCKKCHIMNEA